MKMIIVVNKVFHMHLPIIEYEKNTKNISVSFFNYAIFLPSPFSFSSVLNDIGCEAVLFEKSN